MKITRSTLAVALMAAVAFTAALFVVRAVTAVEPETVPAGEGAARTSFPGLVAAAGEPQLDSLSSVEPRPGTVARSSTASGAPTAALRSR